MSLLGADQITDLLDIARANPVVIRADPVCARNYTVSSGDTCDGISAAQKVSTFQLAHDNPSIDTGCDNLAVGEPLCLGFQGQDCTTVQVVASGDTCSGIASAAGTNFATLLANNPNIDDACDNIYPGEVLCTSKTVISYS
ncbi:hypothetical protein H0H93_015400 [Arthromyces matolae]|nr:hypothetical protein H0H93_015400 [Arthromyces matolae]